MTGTAGNSQRDALIEKHAYLAQITAAKIVKNSQNLPSLLDLGDLESAGYLGLIKAADNYDAARGVKFQTYAIALIRGAILETLRDADWMPRSVRDPLKKLPEIAAKLEMELGRATTDAELAEAAGLTEARLKTIRQQGARQQISFDVLISNKKQDDSLRLEDCLRGDAPAPEIEAIRAERLRLLDMACQRLPAREKRVMVLYYGAGKTFREIGKTLGCSESRAYQLHGSAAKRMRGYLQRESELFQEAPYGH